MSELRKLPRGWERVRFGDVFVIVTGTTPSKKKSEYYGNKFPFFKPTDLEQGIETNRATDNLSKEGYKVSRQLPENSVLVTCIGATIGKTGLIRVKGSCNQQINAILPNERFEPKFVYYQVIESSFQKKIKNNASSTTLPILNKTKFEKLHFLLAPLPEQQRIVEKIEELFSELDEGIENLKKAQAQLKIYRQAVLKYAFEGKFTNKSIKPGELPEGWKWVKLGEVSKINPKLPFDNININTEVSFLPMKRVEEVNGSIDLSELKTFGAVRKGYTPFTNGDVIFAKITPCMENGKMAVVTGLKNNIGFGSTEFHVLRCNNQLNNQYIFYYLVQESFRKKAERNMRGAVGQRRVPKEFLSNEKIPLPPIQIQSKIVEEIESRLSVCDSIEKEINQALKQSEYLRQSILKQAFEGRL